MSGLVAEVGVHRGDRRWVDRAGTARQRLLALEEHRAGIHHRRPRVAGRAPGGTEHQQQAGQESDQEGERAPREAPAAYAAQGMEERDRQEDRQEGRPGRHRQAGEQAGGGVGDPLAARCGFGAIQQHRDRHQAREQQDLGLEHPLVNQ